MNPTVSVIGLREGTMLRVEDERIELLGDKPARVFRKGRELIEPAPGDSLQFLLDATEIVASTGFASLSVTLPGGIQAVYYTEQPTAQIRMKLDVRFLRNDRRTWTV